MPSLDKQSVRQELDTLKNDFMQLNKKGKVSSELKVIVNALFMLMNLMLSVFMEKKTKKNSANSSKPPSQTGKDETAVSTGGSNGKGKLEQQQTAHNTRQVETTTVMTVDSCAGCGECLRDLPSACIERRTRIDIIFEKTVEHYDAQVKKCPTCDTQNKAAHPADLAGPLQYGMGVKAFAVTLLVSQMVALKRTQDLLKTMMGQVLSEATLLNYVMKVHHALERWELSAKETLLKQLCMHTDETSLRVDKKNYWIHVYAAGDTTLKCLHRKRGREAMDAIDIIPRYGGTLVHDCWASYLGYNDCSHGLCGSHLLRELTFIIDSNAYPWAKQMKRLLQVACAMVSRQETKQLSEQQYICLQRCYRNIITRGEKQLPPIPGRQNKKRGKIAKSDAHNLLERLAKYQISVLMFAHRSDVPFTNNRAERDIRMAKVKQKVSGCFRSEQYAHAYCRISSYLQTMANSGVNPLIAIQTALSGQLYKQGGK